MDDMRAEINNEIAKHINKLNEEWEKKLKDALDQYDKQIRQTLWDQFKQQEHQVARQFQKHTVEMKQLMTDTIKDGFSHLYQTAPISLPVKAASFTREHVSITTPETQEVSEHERSGDVVMSEVTAANKREHDELQHQCVKKTRARSRSRSRERKQDD